MSALLLFREVREGRRWEAWHGPSRFVAKRHRSGWRAAAYVEGRGDGMIRTRVRTGLPDADAAMDILEAWACAS